MSVEQPTLEEINNGTANFWDLSFRDIDIAVCKAILKDNPEILKDHPELAKQIEELK